MMRFELRRGAVEALAGDPAVLAGVGQIADVIAAEIARRAPRDTGEGASSIHAEPAPNPRDGFRVGWNPDDFYLSFAEYGTENEPARPFVRPVADEFNRRR